MPQTVKEYHCDFKFALECVNVYSRSTGLGCFILNSDGEILYESGLGCGSCGVCVAARVDRPKHQKFDAGVSIEKGCFGDKHISACRMGLYRFSSPVFGGGGNISYIAAGPFLMTDLDDFIAYDLRQKMSLGDVELERAAKRMRDVPIITPGRVNALSNMLSLMAGFIRSSVTTSQSLEADAEASEVIQGQISDYIFSDIGEDKEARDLPEYPVKTEKRLLASITDSDKPKAQRLLNELLGHILFCSGGDFDRIKSETYELLVLISRGAIEVGVSANRAFGINRKFWREAQATKNIDELCMLLSDVMNQYIDCIFSLSHKKNIEDINKAVQYIWQNYSNKITLEDAAKTVYLSPSYFCKLFQKRVGCNFNVYLNRLRIEKSKQLLLQYDLRIADIVSMVGFEDQSYFTKVFKRIAGVSPTHFRRAIGESAASARYVNVV
ncbi:MAG: helix-turn-helix domain-containing protein [Synergistaceae bacterium]|jgi:AraC-like DNA-binding protein|nr:helix-turn-helix domain-containing protein [Synergistaceae bacterium]